MKDLLVLLHGESPRKSNLLLIYGVSILFTLYLWSQYKEHLSTAQQLLYCVIGVDILGGIIANLTNSTKAFWQKQSLLAQSLFLGIHIVHPVLLYAIFELDRLDMAFLFVYMFVSAQILLNVSAERNRILAVLFSAVGIYCFSQWKIPLQFFWIIIAYLLKLLVGFCIRLEEE